MNAFLWTVAVIAAINTLVVILGRYTQAPLGEVKPWHRLVDCLITACLGLWAAYLLIKA